MHEIVQRLLELGSVRLRLVKPGACMVVEFPAPTGQLPDRGIGCAEGAEDAPGDQQTDGNDGPEFARRTGEIAEWQEQEQRADDHARSKRTSQAHQCGQQCDRDGAQDKQDGRGTQENGQQSDDGRYQRQKPATEIWPEVGDQPERCRPHQKQHGDCEQPGRHVRAQPADHGNHERKAQHGQGDRSGRGSQLGLEARGRSVAHSDDSSRQKGCCPL